MPTVISSRNRLLRYASRKKRLAESAAAAGLEPGEARAALEADAAFFSHELAEAWQVSDSVLRQTQEMLAAAIERGVFETTFELRTQEHVIEFGKLKSEDVLDWLKLNGYVAEVASVIFKTIVRGVAIDLVEFATEALRCTIQGPLTVAIALLRKPFKENLFILEWILADPDDFFERFFSGDAANLRINDVKPDRKKTIIRAAMTKMAYGEWLPAELLYEIRYDKQSAFGFELLWQHANHLVTTQGNLKTESENLNFVFSTAEDQDAQWRAFYTMSPLLFFHAREVVEAAISEFATLRGAVWNVMRLRTLAGMFLWMKSAGCIWNLPLQQKVFGKAVRDVIRDLSCTCGTRVSSREANIRTFFEESKVKCFSCGETIEIAAGEEDDGNGGRSVAGRGPTLV